MDARLVIEKYVTDYGEFTIPSDVPVRAFRMDGWFDRRRKITKQLRAYFSDMTECVRDNKPIATWAEWTKEHQN